MKTIERMLEYFTGLIKKMKGRQRAVPASVVIVIVMICALILPAITPYHYIVMEKPEIEAAYSEGNFEESGMIYKGAKEETGEAAAKDGGSEADDAAAEDNSVREDEVSGEAPSEEAVEETAADDGASDEEAAEADHESADSTDESSAVQTEEKNDGASPSSSDSAYKKAKEEGAATGESATKAAPADKTAPAGNTEEEVRLITEDTQLVYKGSDCSVYAEFGESAKLPVGVKLEVREITKESDPEAYQKYYDKALAQMKGKYGENAKLSFAGFYDITFRCEDKEVEPG